MRRHPLLSRLFAPLPAVPAALVLALALALATAPAGWAASSGGEAQEGANGGAPKKTGPGRGDVAGFEGQYILLDPLWVTVVDEAHDRTFTGGLIIRLEPNPARRVDACYLVPRLMDELIIAFYENRLTRKQQKEQALVRKRVEEAIARLGDKTIISNVSVFEQMPELDDTSMKLSRACR